MHRQRDKKDLFFINQKRNNQDIFYDSESDYLKNVPIHNLYKPREFLTRFKDDDYTSSWGDDLDARKFGGENESGQVFDLVSKLFKDNRGTQTRYNSLRSMEKRKKWENSVQQLRQAHETFYRLNNLLNSYHNTDKRKILPSQEGLNHSFEKTIITDSGMK